MNALIIVLVITTLVFFVMWLIVRFKNQDKEADIKQLKILIKFLDESTRDNVSEFPLEILEDLSLSTTCNFVYKSDNRIRDLYWKIFYKENDKIDLKQLFNYSFKEGKDVNKLGNFIFDLKGIFAPSTRRELLSSFTRATLKASPNNLACIILYAIKAYVEEKVDLESYEITAKEFILDALKNCRDLNIINNFLADLNLGATALLSGHTFSNDHKVEFEYEIIQINKVLKQKN